MALSPATGPLSQTQLAVLEQIRALRAARTAPTVEATAPIPSPARIEAKPTVAQPASAHPVVTAAASPMPANRPRGSIINISV